MDIKRIRLGSNSWRRAKQRQVSILPGRGRMEGKKWEKQAKSVEWRENKAMLSWGRDEGPKVENGERIREIWLVNVPNLVTRDSPHLLIWSRQFLMWRKLHVDIPPSAAPIIEASQVDHAFFNLIHKVNLLGTAHIPKWCTTRTLSKQTTATYSFGRRWSFITKRC